MKIEKAQIEDKTLLLVDGVPQSVYPPTDGGYWKHMVPDTLSGNEVLVLGLGGGTIARLILEKYPDANITGVDNNSLLLDAADKDLNLSNLDIDIYIEDGFEYVKKIDKRFDLIIVDMWNGCWFPIKVLSKEFVKECEALLNDGGQLFINTPSLDYLAAESLRDRGAMRDDIERDIIYQFKLTKIGQ